MPVAQPSTLHEALSHLIASRSRQQEELRGLIQEVKEARAGVEEANIRLQTVSAKLRQVVRRGEPDETSTQIMVFANAHLRMTGALASGIRRASVVDRLLENAEAEQRDRREAAEREAERQEAAERRREREKFNLPLPDPEDAFDELYGEIVDDAE